MMKRTFAKSLIGLTLSLPVIAGTMGDISKPTEPVFYMGAFGGYGAIDDAYSQDGNFTQGRLTLGLQSQYYKKFRFGAELGVQSGNTMRLEASPAVIELAGGLPIQSTLKPLIDALGTVKFQMHPSLPLVGILKGGIAYRQLQLDNRSSVSDTMNKINGELQAGLGYTITPHVQITAMYQGIYSSSARVNLNSVGDVTISQIPTQQAGFLGVEYSFF